MSNIIDTRNMPIPLKLAAHRIKPMTDMPEHITKCKITNGKLTEYTRSDLCVPRSEYDKLKQHADKLCEYLDEIMSYCDDNNEQHRVFYFTARDALAEYRKETE